MASRAARYRKLFSVLAKHGFSDLISLLSGNPLFRFFRLRKASFDRNHFDAERWKRLRMVFEDLGPTWIKFGQILSSRPDVLPEALAEELSQLQDAVPPFDLAEAEVFFLEAFGKKSTELFQSFNTTPIASASIAQVHHAVLSDGTKVAVKVQRPGIEKIIKADILLMRDIASLLGRIKEFSSFRPKELVNVFEKSILEELDFEEEAQHINLFYEKFRGDEAVKIPKVYDDFSGKKIITMEYLEGIKIKDTEQLKKEGYDLSLIAVRGFESYFKMIFEWGYFHADPHPGNLIILPGNVIGILDFGMIGRLNGTDRHALNELIIALGNDDSERIVENIERIQGKEIENRRALQDDIMEFIQEFGSKSFKDIDLNEALDRGRKLIYKYDLRLNPNLFLLLRTISLLEGNGIRLNPEFRSLEMIRPYAMKLLQKKLNPFKLFNNKSLLALLSDLSQLLISFPGDARKVMDKIKNDRLKISTESQSTRYLADQLIRASRMISYTLLAIMFFAGGFLFRQSTKEIMVWNMPFLSILSFSACILFVFLIIRKHK